MSELEVREAKSVAGLRDREGDGLYYCVTTQQGSPCYASRITVACDLPGLHCSMERVRVYRGNDLIWEGPLHSLEGVSYFTAEDLAARGEQP